MLFFFLLRCIFPLQALGVCLGLHEAKNAMVRTAADMTVRQIISLLFDRVADELGVPQSQAFSAPAAFAAESKGTAAGTVADSGGAGAGDGDTAADGSAGSGEGALRCAHLVFQVCSRIRCSLDLCLGLCRGVA